MRTLLHSSLLDFALIFVFGFSQFSTCFASLNLCGTGAYALLYYRRKSFGGICMAWDERDLDLVLVPVGMCLLIGYHAFLFYKVKRNPLQTVMGINHTARTTWVYAVMKDNDKKNILAVQTLRNTIMASTLMASTSILMSSGLAAFISSTYNVKQPLMHYTYGAHTGLAVSVKFMCLLACFLFSFFCYMQSIRLINHVNYLINIPLDEVSGGITPEYVAHVLAKGSDFFTVGTRGFYFAFPLLLWIFGPIPLVICSFAIVPVLYRVDMVDESSYHSEFAKESIKSQRSHLCSSRHSAANNQQLAT
ncbi:hypothetical protein O6H91_09G036800 [Diphasiastrum complanatum]|nr:hypothetical protein O6H91_09G036800 [Diphasiastrum complanatum]